LVEDPVKSQIVAPFLRLLQNITQHYQLAMIISVGAPKTKSGEGYTLTRDKIFGSQMWSRMAETIVFVTEIAEGARDVDIQHRNAKAEHYDMQFANRRLVPRGSIQRCAIQIGTQSLMAMDHKKGGLLVASYRRPSSNEGCRVWNGADHRLPLAWHPLVSSFRKGELFQSSPYC
jgi:hypothetical protein